MQSLNIAKVFFTKMIISILLFVSLFYFMNNSIACIEKIPHETITQMSRFKKSNTYWGFGPPKYEPAQYHSTLNYREERVYDSSGQLEATFVNDNASLIDVCNKIVEKYGDDDFYLLYLSLDDVDKYFESLPKSKDGKPIVDMSSFGPNMEEHFYKCTNFREPRTKSWSNYRSEAAAYTGVGRGTNYKEFDAANGISPVIWQQRRNRNDEEIQLGGNFYGYGSCARCSPVSNIELKKMCAEISKNNNEQNCNTSNSSIRYLSDIVEDITQKAKKK